MLQLTDSRAIFLYDLMITALGGGVQYWATVDQCDEGGSPEQARRASARLTCEDPNDAARTARFTVTPQLLEKGITTLLTARQERPADSYWKRGFCVANLTDGQDGDYDAADADDILQAALFGVIVFG